MNLPDPIEPIQSTRHTFWLKLTAVLAAFSLILLSVQAAFHWIRPEPVNVPHLEDVSDFLSTDSTEAFSSHRPDDLAQVFESTRSTIKQVANYVVAQSCLKSDRLCQSKALFYFVRDEIDYVPDERFHDALENPLITLKTGGADCEDMAVLLMTLQKAIGNDVRLVLVPGHAYAQVSIPDYKNGRWVNLEATCDTCQFGELPNDTALQEKTYIEL